MTATPTADPCVFCGEPCEYKYCNQKCRYRANQRSGRLRPYQTIRQKSEKEWAGHRKIQKLINNWGVFNERSSSSDFINGGFYGLNYSESLCGTEVGGYRPAQQRVRPDKRKAPVFTPRPPVRQLLRGEV